MLHIDIKILVFFFLQEIVFFGSEWGQFVISFLFYRSTVEISNIWEECHYTDVVAFNHLIWKQLLGNKLDQYRSKLVNKEGLIYPVPASQSGILYTDNTVNAQLISPSMASLKFRCSGNDKFARNFKSSHFVQISFFQISFVTVMGEICPYRGLVQVLSHTQLLFWQLRTLFYYLKKYRFWGENTVRLDWFELHVYYLAYHARHISMLTTTLKICNLHRFY